MTTPDATTIFAERYARWEALHHREGPAASYPYAWRLPELARPLGQATWQTAQTALAQDLAALGRFTEARAALCPGCDPALATRLYWLTGGETAPAAFFDPDEAADFAYLTDTPHPFPASLPDTPWNAVLAYWHACRCGQTPAEAAAHHALATLRRLQPPAAAEAEAIFAEARYCIAPGWSVVWLDHALVLIDAYGQHHLKARLLGVKALALRAAGELGESARFLKLARQLAERQGAAAYLRRFDAD